MKKVRITVKKGSPGKKFQIFNSPESLYVWMNDPELQVEEKLDSSLGVTVYLKQGEVMEVEWLGCEFINETSFYLRADYVRLGKHVKIGSSSVKEMIGIQDGWVVDETNRSKHKFDLDELFFARDEAQDFEIDMCNLN